MSISGAIESIGPASLDRLGFEYLVTLGEGDPGLLAARPKMPRRPQPRRIVEAAGAHTHYPAARLAIQPTCTIRAHEPVVQPTAIRVTRWSARGSPEVRWKPSPARRPPVRRRCSSGAGRRCSGMYRRVEGFR